MNLPEAFVENMKDMLGVEWPQFLECYEHNPYQSLRINPLKKGIDKVHCEYILQQFDAKTQVPWETNGFYYSEDRRPGKHVYHEAGLYYIQEPSAMSAAALLAPKPEMRVLDLCAAPGGKTTQLASYLMQRGLLVANEIHAARCRILSQNVERMGIENAIVTNEDSGRLAEKFPSFFHAILVDAPCSGEGMFRKNPEAMEEWSAEQVLVCADRQREILENAATMLLPGGTMVYSTCTFSEEENEQTIDWFLEKHPEFHIKQMDAPWFTKNEKQGTFRLWPHKLHGEGHFAAVLVKDGTLPDFGGKTDIGKKKKSVLDKTKEQALEEFLHSSVSDEKKEWICGGNLILFGEQLYRLPEDAPDLKGLRVLRAGLHVGEFKKNRFEPSHAFALCLGTQDAQCCLNLNADDIRLGGFLRGESIFLNEKDVICPKGREKGWCLICVDGCSVGWGKLAGGQIKNHYPKGLRKEVN